MKYKGLTDGGVWGGNKSPVIISVNEADAAQRVFSGGRCHLLTVKQPQEIELGLVSDRFRANFHTSSFLVTVSAKPTCCAER
jgi:hypothetical protein